VFGEITLAELVESRLAGLPSVVAIFWRDTGSLDCREHGIHPGALIALRALRSPDDLCVLLTGTPAAVSLLRGKCSRCLLDDVKVDQ
jgi:hypothetical protein